MDDPKIDTLTQIIEDAVYEDIYYEYLFRTRTVQYDIVKYELNKHFPLYANEAWAQNAFIGAWEAAYELEHS